MSSVDPVFIPPAQSTVKCDGCDTAFDIDWFCKACPASLCNTCKERHETDRFWGKHTIVPRTGDAIRTFDSSKVKELCSEHSDREIILYCNKCNVSCCSMCIDHAHRQHDIMSIERKYIECEDQINSIANEVEKNTMKELQEKIDDIQKTFELCKKNYTEVKNKVNEFRRNLKDAVDKSCDSLLKELEQKLDKLQSDANSAISALEHQIKENENFIALCAASIRKGGLELLKCKLKPPVSNLPFVSKFRSDVPVFVPCSDLIDLISNSVGEIKYGSCDDDHSPAMSSKGNATKSMDIVKEKNSPLLPTISAIRSFSCQIHGAYMYPAGDGSTWIAGVSSDKMYRYSNTGQLLMSYTAEKGTQIRGMVVNASGDIFVCSSDRKVRLVTEKGKVSPLIDTSPYKPRGLCLNKELGIMVCMAGLGYEDHIAVFSLKLNRKAKHICVRDSVGNQMLTNPTHMAMIGENIAILNDSSNVVTFDQNGKIKWVYGQSQATLESFTPAGMFVDKLSNIVISDRDNHCVHYVDREGNFIRKLLTRAEHGIEYPRGVCVDKENGVIWVGSNAGKKILFGKYLG